MLVPLPYPRGWVHPPVPPQDIITHCPKPRGQRRLPCLGAPCHCFSAPCQHIGSGSPVSTCHGLLVHPLSVPSGQCSVPGPGQVHFGLGWTGAQEQDTRRTQRTWAPGPEHKVAREDSQGGGGLGVDDREQEGPDLCHGQGTAWTVLTLHWPTGHPKGAILRRGVLL